MDSDRAGYFALNRERNPSAGPSSCSVSSDLAPCYVGGWHREDQETCFVEHCRIAGVGAAVLEKQDEGRYRKAGLGMGPCSVCCHWESSGGFVELVNCDLRADPLVSCQDRESCDHLESSVGLVEHPSAVGLACPGVDHEESLESPEAGEA